MTARHTNGRPPNTANLVFDKTEGFHVGFPSRRRDEHQGMAVGDIMELPATDREWTFGLDSMEEVLAALGGASTATPDLPTLEAARALGYRFCETSQGLGDWEDLSALAAMDRDGVVEWIAQRMERWGSPQEGLAYVGPFIGFRTWADLREDQELLWRYLSAYVGVAPEVLAWERESSIDGAMERVWGLELGDSTGHFEWPHPVDCLRLLMSWSAWRQVASIEETTHPYHGFSDARRAYLAGS